jgi:hypothetical protein
VPPAGVVDHSTQVAGLMAVASVAAACLASGYLVGPQARRLQIALRALGLAVTAYLTAGALSGPELVVAWALEAAALGRLASRFDQLELRNGAGAFAALAIIHTLLVEAPPTALVTGVHSMAAAAVALGAIALAAASGAIRRAERRHRFLAGTAATLLYLASVTIITVFQPGTGGAGVGATLLDLSVRQQGQVLLSACWGVLGVAVLVVALRRQNGHLRDAALGMLLITVAKVFLYDLSTLTSIYRVVSFVAVGLLLLGGAFAYQRLRPPRLADMRSVHPSQR